MGLGRLRQQEVWNRILPRLGEIEPEAEDEIIEFLAGGRGVMGWRGLDIGCGLGRHTLAAARLGYRMAAIDFAPIAVERTRAAAASHGLKADVQLASMEGLPFADESFDFIMSWCVLNHGTRASFERAVAEAMRVLRSGGVFVGTALSKRDPRYGEGVKIEEDCYEFTRGSEAGVYHYFPSRAGLRERFRGKGKVERLDEVSWSDSELGSYYPGLRACCHLVFCVRKFD